ncbi:MAG: phosphatidylglycerophosphatase A [Alphaproteobacteria bacterium]|nr:phosphatidylglycerophosphatase A [Alphaproteobacteria bacterium]
MTPVTPRPSLSRPGVLLATWFGVGYLPKAPGTWGSAAALPFAWIIVEHVGVAALALAAAVVFVVGIWAAQDYMGRTGVHDPGVVVIDEVAGQWIVLLAAPLDPIAYAAGFVLFRVFDIFKPWPISWADRRIGGGLGVMVDDVLAGAFGLAILWGGRMLMKTMELGG